MRESVATSEQAGKAGQTGLASEVKETNKALPRLVDLGSDKCSICKMMPPHYRGTEGRIPRKIRGAIHRRLEKP
jgi:hypothetical protein